MSHRLSVDILLTHKFPHFDRNNIDKKRSPYNIEKCSMELATPGAMAEVLWFVHLRKKPGDAYSIVGLGTPKNVISSARYDRAHAFIGLSLKPAQQNIRIQVGHFFKVTSDANFFDS